MSPMLIAAFAGPIALVLTLALLDRYVKGMKTNLLGVVVTAFGGLQTLDLSFLPDAASSALLTGSGIAVLIVSQLTERAEP